MTSSSPNRWDESIRSLRDAALKVFRDHATLVRTGPRHVIAPVFFHDVVINHRTLAGRAAIAYDPERQESLACADHLNELQMLKAGTVWFHGAWNCCKDEITVGFFDHDRPGHDRFIEEVAMEEVAGSDRRKSGEPSHALSEKQLLREYAACALEQRGFRVGQIHHSGRIPRSRLLVSKGNDHSIVAVRTCQERAVQLKLDSKLTWRTIPDVDYVVAAVPADEPGGVEVLGFDPQKLLQVFNAVVSRSPKQCHENSVSIAIDPPLHRGAGSGVHLMAISEWSRTLPLVRNG